MSQARKIIGLMVALGLGLMASSIAFSQSAAVNDKVAERIAPAGSSCMSGDDCAAAPVAAASSGPRSGEDVYNTSCNTCHGMGVAGAPKYGEAADWTDRIAKGMDTLNDHAINGFNAMPPMGLCATCSDEEVIAAVEYLVENSQ
ncbi:cytochrome c5 family protein [Gilvimarinus sp. SDUM040013]|uniref:Cytochrome c5 family protein n=1 Tax=Gilvimarinus gilvus TaxID=3058038 RepID=A0ABU4S1Q9_9GAMM|nr:cytochrome c5 family protein [Gilvimarinus sp. SDUM040013]MDO3388109.1 cytochrome c5 family protein [Gilvimarinus sp. SDUM040013]MDX6850316.1 cytochrome c5 family protein [Gilvimarinus sp. SDUM040013]